MVQSFMPVKWKVSLSKTASDDIKWFNKNNKKLYLRCKKLIKAVSEEPFKGIGKPEHLKHFNKNAWSRRVNLEHRMVYFVYNETKEIDFVAFRHHYKK